MGLLSAAVGLQNTRSMVHCQSERKKGTRCVGDVEFPCSLTNNTSPARCFTIHLLLQMASPSSLIIRKHAPDRSSHHLTEPSVTGNFRDVHDEGRLLAPFV